MGRRDESLRPGKCFCGLLPAGRRVHTQQHPCQCQLGCIEERHEAERDLGANRGCPTCSGLDVALLRSKFSLKRLDERQERLALRFSQVNAALFQDLARLVWQTARLVDRCLDECGLQAQVGWQA